MFDPDKKDLVLGIIGAGAMGSGIAQVAAAGGISVRLHDAQAGVADRAVAAICQRIDALREKGKITAEDASATKGRLRAVGAMADFAGCDAVVEAVIEDLDIKRKVFGELETIVGETCVLASNTSSLPIGAIAATARRPERIAGMHFFNPVPLMRLVEIVRGPHSDAAVIQGLSRLGARMGRTPVVVKDTPGFLVNLGGRAFATEGLAIVHESAATPAQVDAVMRDCCAFRMGPFELMDLTGIDVNFPVTRFIYESYGNDPRLRTTPLHRSLFEAKRLGRKTGRGFYVYRDGKPEGESPDAAVGDAAAKRVVLAEADQALAKILSDAGAAVLDRDDGRSPIVAAPVGEDCAAFCARTGTDHRRFVAIDLSGDVARRITVMTAPGADPATRQAVIDLLGQGRAVTAIADSPGFVAQRILAMVANLGCEMAQMRLAMPADIDVAMRLGLNYPKGPLELCESVGPRRVLQILRNLHGLTGDDRYRPSQWLRRRADLGLSIFTEDVAAPSAPR